MRRSTRATILAEIVAATRTEVARRKAAVPQPEIERRAAGATFPRGFAAALARTAATGHAVIAEVKRASPSKGLIRADYDPAAHARAYEAGGAACLSVLTNASHFQGSDDDLVAAREACRLPVLRKDFTVDPWQAAEARALGADAILVIVAALDDAQMAEIEAAAFAWQMDVLVEVHDEGELDRALTTMRSRLIGVNNRDLRDFSVDLGRTERLAARAPAGVALVAESGLAARADLDRLARAGVRRFLIGETLMRRPDLEAATAELTR